VDVSVALAADLNALTDALDEPRADLETLLRALGADSRKAVSSYLGLTMTLIIDGYPVTLTTIHPTDPPDPADAVASLRLPLSALCRADPGSMLVIYAGNAGAFVDLAADLSFALRLGPDILVLDEDLVPSSNPAGVSGLAEMSQINQAIGILIGRGQTPDSARAELNRLADLAQTTLHAIARQLVRSPLPPPADQRA
jgi:hypothetical protein